MAASASVTVPRGHATRRRRRRRLVMLVVAIGAVASAAATAGGLLKFRDAGSGDADFPASISCAGPASALVCTQGAHAGTHDFQLVTIADAAASARIVGIGIDTGSGTQSTPLYCIRPGEQLACSATPDAGANSFGVYVSTR